MSCTLFVPEQYCVRMVPPDLWLVSALHYATWRHFNNLKFQKVARLPLTPWQTTTSLCWLEMVQVFRVNSFRGWEWGSLCPSKQKISKEQFKKALITFLQRGWWKLWTRWIVIISSGKIKLSIIHLTVKVGVWRDVRCTLSLLAEEDHSYCLTGKILRPVSLKGREQMYTKQWDSLTTDHIQKGSQTWPCSETCSKEMRE